MSETNNAFKVIFNSEENEPIFVSMDSAESITSEMMVVLTSELKDDINKVVYPMDIPKTKKFLIDAMKGFCGSLGIKLEESKTFSWESAGFGGAVVDEERWFSEEYMSVRGVDISTPEKKAKYAELYAKATELAEFAKECKKEGVIDTTLNWYFKSYASKKKA